MRLVNDGNPALLKAMGVDGVVLGCAPGVQGEELGTVITTENVNHFGQLAREARDHGMVCESVYPDWNLIEKTIDDPAYLGAVKVVFDRLAEHGLTDLLISCGLRSLDALSEDQRNTYERRFVNHLGELYRHAESLGLRLCLHTSLMPWIYLNSVNAWDQWFRQFPTQANCIVLCLGCAESAKLDSQNLIEKWRERIRAVHVRNIEGRFDDRSHEDVRLDSGALDLPGVFECLARVDYQWAIIPEHFPEFPCDEGMLVSQAFALGYCRALIQKER